ncbi:unnamed protein product, partial [Parnassius apollo]
MQDHIKSSQNKPQMLLVTSTMTKPIITTSQTQVIYNGLTYQSPILQLPVSHNSNQQPVRILRNNTIKLAPIQINNLQAFTRLGYPSTNRIIRSPLLVPRTTNIYSYNSSNLLKITSRNRPHSNMGPIYVLKKPSQFLHLGNQNFSNFNGWSPEPLQNIIVVPYVPLLTVNEQRPVSLSQQTQVRDQTNMEIPKEPNLESEKESSERAAAIKRIVESFEALEKIIEHKSKERNEANQREENNHSSLSSTSVRSLCSEYC